MPLFELNEYQTLIDNISGSFERNFRRSKTSSVTEQPPPPSKQPEPKPRAPKKVYRKKVRFNPHPYNILLSGENEDVQNQLRKVEIECPPFGVLFDHTLSVVWTVFSGKGHKLSYFQLDWARKVLEELLEVNDTKDILKILNKIVDVQFKKLSDLTDFLSSIQINSSVPNLSVTLNEMFSENPKFLDNFETLLQEVSDLADETSKNEDTDGNDFEQNCEIFKEFDESGQKVIGMVLNKLKNPEIIEKLKENLTNDSSSDQTLQNLSKK